jgi:hypothetical protein
MLCLDCTFGVLVEESSVTRFSLFCLHLHCAVMFTVLFGISSGGQIFRLSSLVARCGLYVIISFFADCCPCRYPSWESGVLWFLRTIEDCPRLFTVVFV